MEYSSLLLKDLEATLPSDDGMENESSESEFEPVTIQRNVRKTYLSRAWATSSKYAFDILGNFIVFLLVIIIFQGYRQRCIHEFETGFKAETPKCKSANFHQVVIFYEAIHSEPTDSMDLVSSHLVTFTNDSRYANDEMWHNHTKLVEVLVNWAKMAPSMRSAKLFPKRGNH